MERKSAIEKLRETAKYKKYGYQAYSILNSSIEILINEGFTDEEIKLLFKHSFVEQKTRKMDPDEMIDFMLNCDYFWEYFDSKADPEIYSTEAILKAYGKYSKELAEKLDERAKNRIFEHRFNDI